MLDVKLFDVILFKSCVNESAPNSGHLRFIHPSIEPARQTANHPYPPIIIIIIIIIIIVVVVVVVVVIIIIIKDVIYQKTHTYESLAVNAAQPTV